MKDLKNRLRFNPFSILNNTENADIQYFAKRELLNEEMKSIEVLWKLPEVEKILKGKISMGLGDRLVVKEI